MAQSNKLKRIFMLVRRGTMDATAVCVYPWEKAILEEVHGTNAEEVTLEEMCAIKGHIKITKQKMQHSSVDLPDLKAQYTKMTEVDPEDSPVLQPEVEWGRLQGTYGMHINVNTSNAEKVYGSYVAFLRVMRDYAAGRTPEMFDTGEGIDPSVDGDGDKPLAEMSFNEVRAKAKELGINTKDMTREQIEVALLDKEGATA